MNRGEAHALLRDCFRAGVAAVDPERAVTASLDPNWFESPPVVLALGKAAPAMARGVATALSLERLEGVVVSNHEDRVPDGLRLILGDHPVPGAGSIEGGSALLDVARRLGDEDAAVALISGGGSALAEVPLPGLDIDDIARTNEVLLVCGADIKQTNVIRQRLSVLKGGGLAAAVVPARLVTLIVSDVVGDSPEVIASGPTVQSTSSPTAALDVVTDLGISGRLPTSVMDVLRRPREAQAETVVQRLSVIAGSSAAAHAAAAAAGRRGLPATVADTRLVGDVAVAAGEALARSRGSVSIFAGETTVNVVGSGTGGRNHEAALVAAMILEGRSDVFFLAAGTDGIDGTTAAAGAIVDGTTLHRARALGLDPIAALEDNDSGSFFDALGDQIVTGPTGTNVGDLWMVLRSV